MKKSEAKSVISLITIMVVILLLIWSRNYITQNTFDKDMYIVKREYSAISDKGIIKLYAGEYIEVVLKKSSHGYKVRIMESGIECYIQDVDLLQKATKADSIRYRNEKKFIEAIREAVDANKQ